jgi:hypothetical protein
LIWERLASINKRYVFVECVMNDIVIHLLQKRGYQSDGQSSWWWRDDNVA